MNRCVKAKTCASTAVIEMRSRIAAGGRKRGYARSDRRGEKNVVPSFIK